MSELIPNPKISPLGPKKSKTTQKLSQNQMSESKETTKMKVVQLHEYTPKQLSNPTPTPKKPIGPQKINNYPKIKLKSKVRIERNIENESCSTT